MALRLHNPSSQAHIEELKDRLCAQLATARPRPGANIDRDALIEQLVSTVRGMDQGIVTTKDALETFSRCAPGFSFVKWLVDMVDEGVYLDTRFDDTRIRTAA